MPADKWPNQFQYKFIEKYVKIAILTFFTSINLLIPNQYWIPPDNNLLPPIHLISPLVKPIPKSINVIDPIELFKIPPQNPQNPKKSIFPPQKIEIFGLFFGFSVPIKMSSILMINLSTLQKP